MNVLGKLVAGLVIIAFVAAIMAWPAMWLWNGTLVAVFPIVPEITVWQALGFCFLFRILFGTGTSSG